jgi:hypothetical protein
MRRDAIYPHRALGGGVLMTAVIVGSIALGENWR